ncbi:hypothetical protein ACIRQT_13840 [Streptomyces californicus]|uniref:hypothetical protein n=1 Tax=Streptomyces californicus TaxID=67351 RepID=UPI0038120E73
MIREPAVVVVRADGTVELSVGLMAEAGIDIGERLLDFSSGDGVITLRRVEAAAGDLLDGLRL